MLCPMLFSGTHTYMDTHMYLNTSQNHTVCTQFYNLLLLLYYEFFTVLVYIFKVYSILLYGYSIIYLRNPLLLDNPIVFNSGTSFFL